ncbi:MAG: WHG domain-containing protein [Rhodospirillaceae bacterium]|nr:WHG domain-containing protein [Rhodospirillaceae bacterium]
MLEAAERILRRDGIGGLSLRAAAREAGVSHAAPKNHFGDVAGLMSELAARGFERFAATMGRSLQAEDAPDRRLAALGRGYVAFARAHPDLFLLMFRSERLDMSRPALRTAAAGSLRLLSEAVGARRGEKMAVNPTLAQLAEIAVSWSLAHGFSMLLIDNRLRPLLAELPADNGADLLFTAMLDGLRSRRRGG